MKNHAKASLGFGSSFKIELDSYLSEAGGQYESNKFEFLLTNEFQVHASQETMHMSQAKAQTHPYAHFVS